MCGAPVADAFKAPGWGNFRVPRICRSPAWPAGADPHSGCGGGEQGWGCGWGRLGTGGAREGPTQLELPELPSALALSHDTAPPSTASILPGSGEGQFPLPAASLAAPGRGSPGAVLAEPARRIPEP